MKSDRNSGKPGHGLPAALKRFIDNRRGAFAMQFALMVVPLMVCTGLAIDGGRAFLAKYELGQALDAAALAIGSTTLTDQTAMEDMADRYVALNFKSPHDGEVDVEVERNADVVTLNGEVTIDTFFMPLIGRPNMLVAAASEVRRGGGNVEVALALDVTASMTMGVDRMTPLRAAAKSLISTVVSSDQSHYYSRVAVVPWASNVNIPTTATTNGSSLITTLRGSVPASEGTVTGAAWRSGTLQSITSAHWRDGSAKQLNASAWKNGAAKTASAIARQTGSGVVGYLKVTSNSHGFSNGDFIRFTSANGGMTTLNSNIYMVADKTTNDFYLKTVAGAYVTVGGGTAAATTASMQKCYSSTCQIQVTATSSHGFSTGDRIYITGITGMTEINNSPTGSPTAKSWTITANSTTTFLINEITGPNVTSTWSGGTSSSKTASECFVATCQVVITTSAAHGFLANDRVAVYSVGGFTQANSPLDTGWIVDTSPGTTTFLIANEFGPSLGTTAYTSSTGKVGRCLNTTCEVQVTVPTSISVGSSIAFDSVSGMTSLNGKAWPIRSKTGGVVVLQGANAGSHTSDYTSGGLSYCATAGCKYFRYTNTSGTAVTKPISNCVSERIGTEKYTDAGPGTAMLSRLYEAGGYNVCGTANRITPLTSDTTALNSAIDAMTVTGSTAGQVGLAWGWYMLSPNWASTWSTYKRTSTDTLTYYGPALYTAPRTKKVLVLMTDGDFNTAHCSGVASQSYGGAPDLINCAPDNDTAANQAQALCNAIRANNVIIYAIGFEISDTSPAAATLSACAPGRFEIADDGTELQEIFDSIAEEIAKLRISQ